MFLICDSIDSIIDQILSNVSLCLCFGLISVIA